jgi:hypothetical protein
LPPGGRSATPPPAEGSARRTLAVVLLATVLLSAVVAALVVAKLLNEGRRPHLPNPDVAEALQPESATSTTATVDRADLGNPAFEIHPQRAIARLPLTLEASGIGCAGARGELSVVRVGEVTDNVDFNRVVARIPVDVDRNGTWSAQSLLVDQPPGAYRVTASCDRRPTADDLASAGQRRDVFTATDMLVLTGPAFVDSFDVSPSEPTPGRAVTVTIAGSGRCPAGSQIAGTIVPFAGAPGRARSFQAPVGSDGTWKAFVSFSAAEAAGSYSVQATCAAGFTYATQLISFSTSPSGRGPSPRPTTAPVTVTLPGGGSFTG